MTVLIVLVAYKLGLLAIGVWASRRVRDEADYFLGGQRLGAWTAGLSYAASTSSAWVLLGFTGAVFTRGLVALWLVPGIFAGYVLTWLVIGPRLNAATRERGHITVVDYLSDGASAGEGPQRAVRLAAAAIILFCFVFYIAAQFDAAGTALANAFGIGRVEAVLVGAAVIVVYCALGGFWAASVTDAVQAVVMLAACVIVPVALIVHGGGLGEVSTRLHTEVPGEWFAMAGAGVAMGLVGTGLGALGQPQLLNRIMAVRSQAERVRGAAITMGWGAVIYSGLTLLAMAARGMGVDTGEEDLIFTAARIALPPVLAGVVVAAVLSAVMSTVDSLLLASASAVSHDAGVGASRPLLSGRLSMAGVAVVAVALTLFADADIFSRVLFAWVALGAAFGPGVLVRSLQGWLGWQVGPRVTLAAMLAGFGVAVVAYNVSGTTADLVETWGSWAVGLLILGLGRNRSPARGLNT